jgi:SAM-dependent methyltransferase
MKGHFANNLFLSPVTGNALTVRHHPLQLYNETEVFQSQDNVLQLLPERNVEYEGSYLNKTRYIPKKEAFPFTLPLWMITNGYVWEVRKQFAKGAIICELGCASGVNYFGSVYNMIGIDYSMTSLKAIDNYQYRIQANAIALPFRDESVDGIISSYFWEHILPSDKEKMLREFKRVLKPGGKVVMVYDVDTENSFINLLKKQDLALYDKLFKEGDYHIGYESMDENEAKFLDAGFEVRKHFGMERTPYQSSSVYLKMKSLPTWFGKFSGLMAKLASNRILNYANTMALRVVDETVGRLVDKRKSRIAISVLQKQE